MLHVRARYTSLHAHAHNIDLARLDLDERKELVEEMKTLGVVRSYEHLARSS